MCSSAIGYKPKRWRCVNDALCYVDSDAAITSEIKLLMTISWTSSINMTQPRADVITAMSVEDIAPAATADAAPGDDSTGWFSVEFIDLRDVQ